MRAALLSRLLLVAGLGSVAACATRPPASDPEAVAEFQQNNDPYEPANRFSYRVSDTLDTYALKPVAQAYVYVLPRPVRGGIHNVLANLSSPVLLANDVLQTKPRQAGDTFMRFLINSSVGVLASSTSPPAGATVPTRPISERPWRSGVCPRVPTCSCPCSARPTCATPRATASTQHSIHLSTCRAATAC